MKNSIIALTVFSVISGAAFAETTGTAAGSAATTSTAEAKTVTLPGGTQYIDEKVGTGAEAVSGKTVRVHYKGTLEDGKEFDNSFKRGQPIAFPLGAGAVIKGWDQGIAGMKVGGKRKLMIPYDQAYGEQGRPPVIPPKAKLIFETELVDVK